ncbi:MAG: hypothetical protein DRN49_07075 [Thaumarchaeota archaeon]|nr:MAG: hypothetical protein DRN49_07075 [Nitrososphaerota archaeon]
MTQAQAQALGLGSPQARLWFSFMRFSDRLSSRLREVLEQRGIRVRDVSVLLEDYSNDEVRYRVEIDIMIYEAARVYHDGIYESCSEAIGEKVAEGEITEDEAEEEVERCVDEEVAKYDEEYGEPPFTFRFSSTNIEAELVTEIDDDGYARSYIDVLKVVYMQSPYSWVFERASDRDIERMVEAEVSQILPTIERLYKATKALYEG